MLQVILATVALLCADTQASTGQSLEPGGAVVPGPVDDRPHGEKTLETTGNVARAPKQPADGSRLVRGNRLMSVQSPPGAQLSAQDRPRQELQIKLDGIATEAEWRFAPRVDPLLDAKGVGTGTSVRVLHDAGNIYLHWTVDEVGGVTARLEENDGVITGDDYVQVRLTPWLPPEITIARDYYYTIAVNPRGVVWDAYFDPYLGGHFFSSWNAGAQVVTTVGKSRWTAEMIIPFAGLDHSSNPGRPWALSFVHSSQGADGSRTSSSSGADLLVRQGVLVRRKNLVDYYWTRPEFLQEVKPPPRVGDLPGVRVAVLDHLPETNGRPDASLWKDVPATEIAVSDRHGRRLERNTARARIGRAGDHLTLALEADGSKRLSPSVGAAKTGEGMAAQTASVNGVFVDGTLFADECFWIVLAPRDPALDRVHQTYHLVLVSNRGEVRGTRYDRFGTPDRSWEPRARADLYDTRDGWGAEVTIPLSALDLPVDGSPDWGLNLFRNRRFEVEDQPGGAGSRSELQAWIHTATDFLNPDTFGTLEGMEAPDADVVSAGLLREIERLKAGIASRSATHPDLARRLRAELAAVDPADRDEPVRDELRAAASVLEQVDRQLGVAAARDRYRAVPHPGKGGHAILDLQLGGEVGWAVGAMGTVLRTGDGGRSWESIELETDDDLYRVSFPSEREGWAAGGRIRMAETNDAMRHDERGGHGTIFHTTDGGRTWDCQYAERGRHIFGLSFVNEKLGFACGELGFLLKTVDGGETWRELRTTGTWRWLYGIAFLDETHGFAVGESETVIETRDGGATWESRSVPADRRFYGFRPFYRDIVFSGSTGCIVGQNGTVVISRDAGATWENAATFVDPRVRELLDFSRVAFPTPRHGFAVSELGTKLLVTEDAGRSWSLKPVPNSDWLRAVRAAPGGRLVLAGEREKILESRDHGATWTTLRGDRPKADVLVMLAHGDDAAIELGGFLARHALNDGKQIVDVEVLRDAHSVEYRGEIYNLEHHRAMRMSGVRTTTYFDEFENGNNGSDYYHYTRRLWQGEENVVRHMVAAIRAYRPDVMIIHDGVFGDYDKPGHKLSGRAGIPAFETSGGGVDRWPELTRLGLEPWQPRKLYALAGESYPPTLDTAPLGREPLSGTAGTCLDWAEYVLRNFQSQGVYHARSGKLSLIRSHVDGPSEESSVFDGLERP